MEAPFLNDACSDLCNTTGEAGFTRLESESVDLLNSFFAEALSTADADPRKLVKYVKMRINELDFLTRERVEYLMQMISGVSSQQN
jgi:hypothetical protein